MANNNRLFTKYHSSSLLDQEPLVLSDRAEDLVCYIGLFMDTALNFSTKCSMSPSLLVSILGLASIDVLAAVRIELVF